VIIVVQLHRNVISKVNYRIEVFFSFLSNNLFIDLLKAVEWLLCYILEKSAQKVDRLSTRNDLSGFELKNIAQVYHLRTLSIIYIQVNRKLKKK
jgi:hypothetical protein